jgi:hypothetical protein
MSRLGFDEACPKTPSFLTPQVADSTHSIFVSFACPKSDDFGAEFLRLAPRPLHPRTPVRTRQSKEPDNRRPYCTVVQLINAVSFIPLKD